MTGGILTLTQVASVLDVDRATVHSMIARGELPALAVACGDALISETSLEEFVAAPLPTEWEDPR